MGYFMGLSPTLQAKNMPNVKVGFLATDLDLWNSPSRVHQQKWIVISLFNILWMTKNNHGNHPCSIIYKWAAMITKEYLS
jgi:hypothetical protein